MTDPHAGAARSRQIMSRQQRLRLSQPLPPVRQSRRRRTLTRVKHILVGLFSWSNWGKVAPVATGLAAVAALWFSGQSLRQTQNQYALSEQGQLSDRFGKSIEQLGSEKTDVKLGAIYSLEQLARDSTTDRSVVFEVLSAYVRSHAGRSATGCPQSGPLPVDIQAALTVIGRREGPYAGFDPWNIDQQTPDQRTIDEKIDLSGACLPNANLGSAQLPYSVLEGTNLSNARITETNLWFANLSDTNLVNAKLTLTDLGGADLQHASLVGAELYRADLTGADLTAADLTGAHLTEITYDGSTRWPQGVLPKGLTKRSS